MKGAANAEPRPSWTRGLLRHATTLVLVALAIAAALWVFVLDRGSVSTSEAEQRKRNLFEAWQPEEIVELTVTASVDVGRDAAFAGPSRTARLSRGEANDAGQRPWSVEIDGVSYAADEQAVDQLLGTLEFATAERRVSRDLGPSGATDRAALGLEAPRLSVAIVMGARRERLIVGGSAPTPPGAAYAEVSGRGLFVITKQLAAALDVSPERFRTKRFVPYASTEIDGIAIDGEGGQRRFVRAPWGGGRGGGFRFEGPANAASRPTQTEGPANAASRPTQTEGSTRVGAAALDRVLSALDQIQAEAFLSDEQAERALSKRVTLTLRPRDPAAKPAVIELGGACPAGAAEARPSGAPDAPPREPGGDRVVALRREPTRAAACVPGSVLEALVAEPSDFVDRALVAAPLDEIVEVKLAEGPRTLELARVESAWHLRSPEDRPLPAETGRAVVQAILDVEATRLVPADKADGVDPPRATLRIVSTPPKGLSPDEEPSERVETLEIGAERGGIVRVRRLEDGAVLEIPAAAAGALLPSELSLRSSQVLDVPVERVRSIRVQAGGVVQRLQRTATGAWELLEPTGEGLRADLGLASDLAEVLSSLKAARWITAEAAGGYGLSAPRIRIEAEIAATAEPPADGGDKGARTVRVDLGAATSGGSFARTGDAAAVFVAPDTLEAAAGRLLLDRSVFLVAPERIARVTLLPQGGAPVVITASPGGWTLAPPGGATDRAAASISAALAAGVRDALAGLVAEGAVSLGAPERPQGFDRPKLRVTVELTPTQGATPAPIRITLGAGDAFRGTSVVYARRDGVAATYALAQAKVRPLLDAAGLR